MTQDNDTISQLFATSPNFQLVRIWKDEECVIHVHLTVTGSGGIRQKGYVDPLTKREGEVLLLLAEGKTISSRGNAMTNPPMTAIARG